jgi:hypothetical protein
MLTRNKAKIRREFPSVFEVLGRSGHSQKNRGGKNSHSRYPHQAAASFMLLGDVLQGFVLIGDLGVKGRDVLILGAQQPPHGPGKAVFMIINDRREMKADMTSSLLENNAVLSQQASNLVNCRGPCLDKTSADTMNGLNVRLLLKSCLGTKRMRGRCTASQIASASLGSFFSAIR